MADRLEIHDTPQHGSWLDMAEAELGILGRQRLDRRIDNVEELTREVAAWEAERNASPAKVNWRFTTPDAGIKLRKLYPSSTADTALAEGDVRHQGQKGDPGLSTKKPI